MNNSVIVFLSSLCFAWCFEHDFKGFDDTILFGINWPGKPENLQNFVDGEAASPQLQNNEILKVTTSTKENYECQIPELKEEESTNIAEYDGPSPIHLLKPLFSQKICSYRLESYWSYEVCHGRYIRQYHEEREGKQVNTQGYYLGHWSTDKQAKLEAEMKAAMESKATPKTTKVDGGSLPYVEMAMDDGTICDLSGKPRLTRVRYVCYPHGKHEVYSFKETSTCEYEIIILSPLLCDHPLFKPKDVGENIINCLPVDDAPKKPRNLLKMEVDSLRFHHQTIRLLNNDQDPKDVLAVLKVEKIEKDGKTQLKFELHPLNEEEDFTEHSSMPSAPQIADKSTTPPVTPITDDSPVRAFLNGENCLNGGTGWWKYEFCYGKHVVQYHLDRDGGKTTLLLGEFNEAAHLYWIKENKGKAPKPLDSHVSTTTTTTTHFQSHFQAHSDSVSRSHSHSTSHTFSTPQGQRTSISHFYSGGDICDKTGKPRQTEVKLKCLENSSSPAQVSLYLLEPRTCHYILGVESPLICDILPLADENGLIKSAKPVLARQDNVPESNDDDSDFKHKYVVKHDND